jgi:putative tricarboxylic transport membrane protein
MHNFMLGLQTALLPMSILYIALGVGVGILGGAMPGINGAITTSLLLPFTFTMRPEEALMMLVGTYVGVEYGGSIPAILIGTPGTAAAGATLLDGFPMRQQGKAGLALFTSLTSSTIGTMVSGMVLLLVALPLARAALSFGSAEYFGLAVLGLTMIVSLSEQHVFKGIMAGAFGMLISTVGMDEFLGIPRFAFGNNDLAAGIDTVPVMMGVFAMGMMLLDFWKPPVLDNMQEKVRMTRMSRKSFIHLLPVNLFAGLIGVSIGALPGTGSAVATYVSYNQIKQMSKKRDEFGTGIMEGVAASEAANNGCTGGALIPMLGLGIPGSGTTAVMLGALTLHGITAGPNLFISNPKIPYSIFVAIFMAAIIMFFFGLIYTRLFLKVILMPQYLLNTCIVLIVLTGAYAVERNQYQLIIVLCAGVISYFLRRCKVPITPVVLGLILGYTVERSMRRALMLAKGAWSTFLPRPIRCIMLVVAAITLGSIIWRNYGERIRKKHASTGQSSH